MRRRDWGFAKDKLDELYGAYDSISTEDLLIRSHWIRYLIVITSGFMETSVRMFYTQYAEDKSSPKVHSFVLERLDRPGNMRMDKLLRLVGEFDRDWRCEIESHSDFARLKASLNSLVTLRNSIAHGENVNTGMVQLKSYYDDVVIVLEMLFSQCDRDSNTQRLRRGSGR